MEIMRQKRCGGVHEYVWWKGALGRLEDMGMEKVTVYDKWKNGEFQRYCLDKEGRKVILEESKGQPPFVKVELVRMGWNRDGDARSAEE